MRRLTSLLVLATMCSGLSGAAESSRKILILYDEKPQMDILAKRLQAEGYTVDWTSTKEQLGSLDSYFAVVVFVHSQFPAPQADAVIAYTQAGGRMIALHHSISSAKAKTPQWLNFLGVVLPAKKPIEEGGYVWQHDVGMKMVNLAPKHYITTHNIQYPAKAEYKRSDTDEPSREYDCLEFPGTEAFINHTFTDGKEKTVLYGFICQHPKLGDNKVWMQDRAGWLKPAGKGWIFYFMPGHTVKDLENPIYQQIILNCLSWKP